MMITPKRYSIFIDDANRARARELEKEMATTFSGLVRDLIRSAYDKRIAPKKKQPAAPEPEARV
jgi:hypothetical protein